MTCLYCKKKTISLDKMCGKCQLNSIRSWYGKKDDTREFVKNMSIGAYEQSKQEFIDKHI